MRIDPRRFFSKGEKDRIVEKIGGLERRSSGEIRIHIDTVVDRDPIDHAKMVFEQLGMARTAERNGVLIYINIAQKRFAIIGDKGINKVVPADFWQDLADEMGRHLAKGDYLKGVLNTIEVAGDTLSVHFPHRPDDVNEMRDNISYGREGDK